VIVTGAPASSAATSCATRLAHADARLVVLDLLTYAGSLENLRDVIDGDRVVFVQATSPTPRRSRRCTAISGPARSSTSRESHVDRSIERRARSSPPTSPVPSSCWKGAARHLAGADAGRATASAFLHSLDRPRSTARLAATACSPKHAVCAQLALLRIGRPPPITSCGRTSHHLRRATLVTTARTLRAYQFPRS